MAPVHWTLLVIVIVCWTANAKIALLHRVQDPGEGVCLDGSQPSFYYRPGTGSGADKVIVHLEGGGVCESDEDCLQRSKTHLGSSKDLPETTTLGGFLSDLRLVNPDFHEWGVVFVNYCDGGIYSGYVSDPIKVGDSLIYYRGYKVLQAIFKFLLNNHLNEAKEVILTGCSAGGIATYIHTDYVMSLLPSTTKFKAMADAGYFVDVLNVDGEPIARERGQKLFKMQNMTMGLSSDCAKVYNGTELYKCIGSQYLYPFIKSPIFAFNSQYDTWQLDNNLELKCRPPNCTQEELQKLDEFHQEFMTAASPIVNSTTNGAFLDSCFAHCQSLNTNGWSRVKIGGQSAAETFANWYFEKSTGSYKEIDCPSYSCNPTC